MEYNFALRKYNLEKELYRIINQSGIPVCFVDDIVKNIYMNVHSAAKSELEEQINNINKKDLVKDETTD